MTNFNFSDIIEWDALSEAERTDILRRPAVMEETDLFTAATYCITYSLVGNDGSRYRKYQGDFLFKPNACGA